MPLEIEIRERFRFYELSSSDKKKVIEKLKKALEKHEEILLAAIYGSFLKDVPFRDIDVAVYVKQKVDPLNYKFELDDELSETLKYPVDTKILNEAPAWFTLKVLEEGEILVERVLGLVEKLYMKALDEKNLIELRREP